MTVGTMVLANYQWEELSQTNTEHHLESDGILRRPGDEVVRNARRIVVLWDFDRQRVATGVSGAVADDEWANVMLRQDFQRHLPAQGQTTVYITIPQNYPVLLTNDNSIQVHKLLAAVQKVAIWLSW